jgi:hypothetical protein
MITAKSAWWPRFFLRVRCWTVAVWAAHAAVSVACAPSTSRNPAGRSTERDARDSLHVAIGSAQCFAESECRLVPVGAKPCGGPRGYSAFSTTTSDTLGIRRWADSLRVLERKLNEAEGRVSDCAMVIPPVVRCGLDTARKQGPRICSTQLKLTPNR